MNLLANQEASQGCLDQFVSTHENSTDDNDASMLEYDYCQIDSQERCQSVSASDQAFYSATQFRLIFVCIFVLFDKMQT